MLCRGSIPSVVLAILLTPPGVWASSASRQAGPPQIQAPARDLPAKPPVATGAIRGRVVRADTGDPLPHAGVSLSPRAGDGTTLTDRDGRFEFTGLPANRYRLSAAKRSYLQLEYGQRRPRESGKLI